VDVFALVCAFVFLFGTNIVSFCVVRGGGDGGDGGEK